MTTSKTGADIILDAGSRALASQSWFSRRKDSITATAAIVLQTVQLFAVHASDMPGWASIIFGVIIFAAQLFVHAGTPGAITPKGIAKLQEEAEKAESNEARGEQFAAYKAQLAQEYAGDNDDKNGEESTE